MNQKNANSWHDCGHLRKGEAGKAKLFRREVTEHESMMSVLRGGGLEFCPVGIYWNLTIAGSVVMSNTRLERITNAKAIRDAHGQVLIAGLGLGMVLCGMLQNSEVDRVTVLEVEPDVIRLIGPMLPVGEYRLILANVFSWKPDRKFNVIWFDIWPDICTDNLGEIVRLHRKYKGHLDRDDPKCWMNSWMAEELRSRRRLKTRG